MKLRTLVRDCLYLNWALPVEALPAPPAPLRYEIHPWQGHRYAFASALLFRQAGLHLAALPVPRLSYPQFNLRLYVLDGEGVPSVLFRRMLVPAWAVPGAWLARQPAAAGRFSYPQPAGADGGGTWRWRVSEGEAFEVEAKPASPAVGEGPRFSSWDAAVHYFRCRNRGYSETGSGLRRIDTEQRETPVWPLQARVAEAGLLERLLSFEPWPEIHSAFLCPEVPFVFELAPAVRRAIARPPTVVAADPAILSGPCNRRAAA
jgi:hypothetical protein